MDFIYNFGELSFSVYKKNNNIYYSREILHRVKNTYIIITKVFFSIESYLYIIERYKMLKFKSKYYLVNFHLQQLYSILKFIYIFSKGSNIVKINVSNCSYVFSMIINSLI